jgi:hypothetical protein
MVIGFLSQVLFLCEARSKETLCSFVHTFRLLLTGFS